MMRHLPLEIAMKEEAPEYDERFLLTLLVLVLICLSGMGLCLSCLAAGNERLRKLERQFELIQEQRDEPRQV
jgi:hypothetical protein